VVNVLQKGGRIHDATMELLHRDIIDRRVREKCEVRMQRTLRPICLLTSKKKRCVDLVHKQWVHDWVKAALSLGANVADGSKRGDIPSFRRR
jgi:hypothetical protein